MYDRTETLLECASTTPGIVRYTLQHRPAQVNFYGKALSEAWGAIFFMSNGTTGGKWFDNETDATTKYAQWAGL